MSAYFASLFLMVFLAAPAIWSLLLFGVFYAFFWLALLRAERIRLLALLGEVAS